MTTVVFDGKLLAADSQSTRSAKPGSHCLKCHEKVDATATFTNKIKKPDLKKPLLFNGQTVVAWAGAGAVPMIHAMDYAMEHGVCLHQAARLIAISQADSRCKCRASASMLVVTTTSAWRIRITGHTVTIVETGDNPEVIGSGTPAAHFALRFLNANAIVAVAAAIEGDKGSSGPINYVNCRSKGANVFKSVDDSLRYLNTHLAEYRYKKVKT